MVSQPPERRCLPRPRAWRWYASALGSALPAIAYGQGSSASAAVPGTSAGLLTGVALGAAIAFGAVAWAHWLRERRARHAREAAAQDQRAALAACADLVWRADADGRVRSIEALGRPLPAAVAAATGRPLWQLVDASAPCPAALAQRLAARQPLGELVLTLPGATATPWLVTGVPQGDGYRGTARDLSSLAAMLAETTGSRAQAEEIARLTDESARLRAEAGERSRQHDLAARELDSFAHSVSHDLRAPLRVVDGFATILMEDYAQPHKAIDDLGQEHIRRIIGAGQRMNAMIDTLLAMSRMTSRDLERERVNLSQLARELADELKAGDRSRRVEFAIQPDLATEGDRTLLRLVLQNLLGNAFKFTGRVAVGRIEVAAEADADGRRVYRVRDNGAGFDPRFADKMFGLFQRFHSANEFPGTGVGLATVQRIVRKHGGRIWAESQPGEGATFFFTLWE